jgi:hypothetical protein
VTPPKVTTSPSVTKPKLESPAAKIASQKSGESIPKPSGFKQVTDWQDNPYTRDSVGNLGEMFATRMMQRSRYFYDEGSDVGVSIPNVAKVSEKNLEAFLKEVNDAVMIARRTMPLDHGKHRRMKFNVETKGMKNANAYTYIGHDTVTVNKNQMSLVLNSKKKMERNRLARWSVSTTDDRPVLRTLVHEMGHDSDSNSPEWKRRREALYRKWVYEGADPEATTIIKDAVEYIGDESKRAKRKLNFATDTGPLDRTDGPTIYARTNSKEMFAEAFALWHVDGVASSKLSPLMKKWVTEFAEEFGWKK